MKIGILCADDREAAPFISMLKDCETTEKAMLKFHQGKISDVEAVVLFAGVGKTNAALAAQILIDSYACDAIINAGTAGGMDESLAIFDTIICTESAYHDVDPAILAENPPMLESASFQSDAGLVEAAKKAVAQADTDHSVYFGKMVTGDQFVGQARRVAINQAFAPLGVDMETAAVAHVCHVNGIAFLAVRTITDTAQCSGVQNYEENCVQASQITAELVKAVLSSFREMHYYNLALSDDAGQAVQGNAMKEKFIALLAAKGIAAEMGLTPVTSVFVMHMEQADADVSDYWFVESDGGIEARITNFIRWNISHYIFACVENGDYLSGRYAVGRVSDLKDFNNPQGVSEAKGFMTLDFNGLVQRLKQPQR